MYGAVTVVFVSVEPGQVGGEREASVFTGEPDSVRDGVVLAMHHVVRHPAIESGEHLHTDRGFSVGAFPQVPAHVYVEPVGCGICKTGVAQAASTGCFDIGADGRIHPFFAFQDLEKRTDNDITVIFDWAFSLHGKALVTRFRRHLIFFLEAPVHFDSRAPPEEG